jgi:hypothetical protein
MMAALELPAMAERLMPPKRSVMNSRFPKPMVSPREKISHDRHSPSAAMVSIDGGSIGTSIGKACCNSPFLASQVLLFFAPARYRVVKIARSYSKMVL